MSGLMHGHKPEDMKKLLQSYLRRSKVFELSLEKLREAKKKIDQAESYAHAEHYLRHDLKLELRDIKDLERIKHCVEKLQEIKLEELEEDEHIIHKWVEEHKLTETQARSLLHQIHLIKSYMKKRSKKASKKEREFRNKI